MTKSTLALTYPKTEKITESLKEKLLRLKEYREQGTPNVEIRTQEGIDKILRTLVDETKVEMKDHIELKTFSRPDIIPTLYFYQDLGNHRHYVLFKHSLDGYNFKYSHLTSDMNQLLLQPSLNQQDLFHGTKERVENILEQFKVYEEKEKLNSIIKDNQTKTNNNKI